MSGVDRMIGKKFGVILGAIVAVTTLSAAIAILLLWRYPIVALSESDLVEIESEFSSLHIPSAWQQFEIENGVQFGNTTKDGSSSAVITVIDNGFFRTNLVEASTDQIKAALEYSGKLPEVGLGDDNCTDPQVLIDSANYPKINPTTRELLHTRIECSTPSGKRAVQDTRVVVGTDGYMRGTVLTVRLDDWRVNEKVYTKVLDSIVERS